MTTKKNKRSKHRRIYDAALRRNALSKSKAVSFMKRKQLDGFGRKINASEKTSLKSRIRTFPLIRSYLITHRFSFIKCMPCEVHKCPAGGQGCPPQLLGF